ncbi:uncharacterized protein EAE97_001881 [Botrytis byssoidea]|uniref:Uncharacterized protein n=1 Tax=Botrytis byssoidea TaxID=139641 RepID=A0A9P5M7Z7_9HELO|nr:uncharacterized protein EAE97_001881 [Botrytis byssoidea]KAF7952384.1 hypothetical protein EAE97_001881 [Botrytis byssoidea]
MDGQGDGSAKGSPAKGSRNRDSRRSQRDATGVPLPLSPQPPTRQNPPITTTTTTANTAATPNTTPAPQPRRSHQHPIPPPIHPPFHPYTPQLNPPVSTPESLPNRRNFPTLAPLPIANIHQPGQPSYSPHQGVFGGASLGAGLGASHAIPVGGAGDMQAGTSSNAGLPNSKGRYTLKKRESNPNRPATVSKPYIVRPKSRSGAKSSRVSKSKKRAQSSGTATPAAEDFERNMDTVMETLTGVMVGLNNIGQVIRNVQIQARAAAAAAAGRGDLVHGEEEDEEEDEEEEEEEESMLSDYTTMIDFANMFKTD